MRSIADTIRSLLGRVRKLAAGPPITVGPPDKSQFSQKIHECRKPAAIPWLLDALFVPDADVHQAAAHAIERIVERTTPPVLARLDASLRKTSEWRYPAINPDDTAAWSCGLCGTLGVLSFHPSGYVREAAIRLLDQVTDGAELPFLLIRLNDWVQQVRDSAKEAVVRRIRAGYAIHFARNLPLIDRLPRQGRDVHGKIHSAILMLLQREPDLASLRAALVLPCRQTNRIAFRLILQTKHADHVRLLRDALKSGDTVIRLWAARELRARLDGQALRDVPERFSRDPFMPVRREAMYGFLEKLPESAPCFLQKLLLDLSASMRDAARFYLRKAGRQDFAAYYAGRLAETEAAKLAAAIAGLAETGTPADAEPLLPFLGHPAIRIRRATVRAVGHLDADAHAQRILAALEDGAASVAKAARDVLRSNHHLASVAQLWAVFQRTDKPHVRRLVLMLIAERRWWECAPLLVLAAGSSDEIVRDLACESLRHWRRNDQRMCVRPTRVQLQALEDAMKAGVARFDRETRTDLEWALKYATRELI